MRWLLLAALGGLALTATTSFSEARDGCGPGYYYNGYRCRPMEREYYGPPPSYGPPPYVERRVYGPPGGWEVIHGRSNFGAPEVWYVPRGGRCPGGFTIQDGICKRYRGY